MTQFIPKFGSQNWIYQSFLITTPFLDLVAEPPNSPVPAKKWAMGQLVVTDCIDGIGGSGILTFTPDIQLEITITGKPGSREIPATFEAMGKCVEGVAQGAEYQLSGWAFSGSTGNVVRVGGAIHAVRGPDTNPKFELGGMPIGTVGTFSIDKE